jgi:hypothetical protein
MTNSRLLAAAGTAALAAGLLAGWQDRAAAAAPKPALDVTFGPIQVEGDSRATFFLALRNTGTADGKLVAGDRIEIRYGTGGGAGDLLAAGRKITVEAPPAGIVPSTIDDGAGHEIGVALSVSGDVVIPTGGAQVLLLKGATASPGGAPVKLGLKLSKDAGKAPKSLALSVVKTPPATNVDFYGDGSDGALVVADGAVLQTLGSYTDFTVPAGAMVSVPAGATIRCTGTFENRGKIVVLPGSPGGGVLKETANLGVQVTAAAAAVERGDSFAAARIPAVFDGVAVAGAKGGKGLGLTVHSLPLSAYRVGGGGGSGALGAVGGDGGGLLRVIARGPIRNGGVIEAKGRSPTVNRTGLLNGEGGGAGAGGGGIVILASGASVDNTVPANANGGAATGTIDVSGGSATTADPSGGGGGGGGGGLVVFCAPAVPSNGTVILFGGLSAFQTLVTNETIWAGGGGGGACVGDGGEGAPVRDGGNVGPPPGGGSDPASSGLGLLVIRTADPRTLWQ